MNVLFVYPDIFNYALYKGTFYTGIASLSASLKHNVPCSVSLIHLIRDLKQKEFMKTIRERKPDLIAFSTTTNMFGYVKKWAGWIKNENPQAKTVCGGVHPTICPEEVIQNTGIDIVCIGEGDESIVELCRKLINNEPIFDIRGLWVKDDQQNVHKNPIRPVIEDLDSLPLPDRNIFDYPNLHSESEGKATVMLSRGCPYACSYCCNDILRRAYGRGKYVRFKSVPNAIRELQSVLKDYPFIKSFVFDDDILPLQKKWFKEFASEYKNKIDLPYDCNLRPNLVDKETVDLLKESGCYQVRMGIESGNDFIRNRLLNRNISAVQIESAFRLCKKAGLKIYSYNMIGLPFEDLGMMLETVKINSALPTDANQVTIFYPYEKTPLYNICKKEGLTREEKEVSDYSRDTILNFNRIRRSQIIFIQRYFRLLVKFYGIANRKNSRFQEVGVICLEKILFSSLASIILLPVLNMLIDVAWRNRFLGNIARKINRQLLKG